MAAFFRAGRQRRTRSKSALLLSPANFNAEKEQVEVEE